MVGNFKNILIGILSAIIVLAVGASAYNAFASPAATDLSSNVSSVSNEFAGGNGNGNNGNGNGANGGNGVTNANETLQLESIPVTDLSGDEAAAVLFMREEEKLARDVYNQMFTLWGQRVFQNIAASEQTHMDQVKYLMDRYGLADPALAPGQFSDPNLQALYDQLISQGSVSLDEALKVGALIEQTDIADLQTRLSQTDNADVQLVYNNLMNASYNHLSSFAGGAGQGGNGRGNGGGNGQGGNGRGNGRPQQ